MSVKKRPLDVAINCLVRRPPTPFRLLPRVRLGMRWGPLISPELVYGAEHFVRMISIHESAWTIVDGFTTVWLRSV